MHLRIPEAGWISSKRLRSSAEASGSAEGVERIKTLSRDINIADAGIKAGPHEVANILIQIAFEKGFFDEVGPQDGFKVFRLGNAETYTFRDLQHLLGISDEELMARCREKDVEVTIEDLKKLARQTAHAGIGRGAIYIVHGSHTEELVNHEATELGLWQVKADSLGIGYAEMRDWIKIHPIEANELNEVFHTLAIQKRQGEINKWLSRRGGLDRDPLYTREEISHNLEAAVLNLEESWRTDKVVSINGDGFRLTGQINTNAYQAVGIDIGQRVIIKASDERENILSKVAHQLGIGVRVIGYDDISSIMVLEDVGGRTLFEMSQEGSLTLGVAMEALGKTAEYIEFLRKRGIVHGDVAARNILVSEKGIFLIDYSHAEFSNRLADSKDLVYLGYLIERLTSSSLELLRKEYLNHEIIAGLSRRSCPLTMRIILADARKKLTPELRQLPVQWLQSEVPGKRETGDGAVLEDTEEVVIPMEEEASLEPSEKRTTAYEVTSESAARLKPEAVRPSPERLSLAYAEFAESLQVDLDGFTGSFSRPQIYPLFSEGVFEFIIEKIKEKEGNAAYTAFIELFRAVQFEGRLAEGIFAEYLRWDYPKYRTTALDLANQNKAEIWKQALRIQKRFGILTTVGFLKFAPYLVSMQGSSALVRFTDIISSPAVRCVSPVDSVECFDRLRHILWQDYRIPSQSFDAVDSWMTFSIVLDNDIEYIFSFGIDEESFVRIAEVWYKDGKALGYGGTAIGTSDSILSFRIFEDQLHNVPDRAAIFKARLYLYSRVFPSLREVFVEPNQFGGEDSTESEYALQAGVPVFYIRKLGMKPDIDKLAAEDARGERIKSLVADVQQGRRLGRDEMKMLTLAPMRLELSASWRKEAEKRFSGLLSVDPVIAHTQDYYLYPEVEGKVLFRGRQGKPSVDEGWILHVGSLPRDAGVVLDTVLPILSQENATHKVANGLEAIESLNQDPRFEGLLVVIYPSSTEEAVRLADILDNVLYPLRQRGIAGRTIPIDASYGDSSFIGYCWGGNRGYFTTPIGDRVPVSYTPGQYKPDWITENPFSRTPQGLKRILHVKMPNPLNEIIRQLKERFGLDVQLDELPDLEAERVEFEAGDVILEEGASADALYIIEKGEVEVPIVKDGISLTYFKGRGNIFGEMGTLGLRKRSATVKAGKEGVVLRRISYEKLFPIIRDNPQIFFILGLYVMEIRVYQADLVKIGRAYPVSVNVQVREQGPGDDKEEIVILDPEEDVLDTTTLAYIRRLRQTGSQHDTPSLNTLLEYARTIRGHDISARTFEAVCNFTDKNPNFWDIISNFSEQEKLFLFYKLSVIYDTAKVPFAKPGQTPKARMQAYLLQYQAEDALARTIIYASEDGTLELPRLSQDKAHLYGYSSAYSELTEYEGVLSSLYRAIMRGEFYYEMAIDLNFWTPGAYLAGEMSQNMKDAIRILAERSGIRMSFHGPIFYAMPGVKYESKIVVDAYNKTIDLAKEIGAKSVVVHVTSGQDIDDLVAIASYGAGEGVEISLENSREREGPYQNADRFLAIVQQVVDKVGIDSLSLTIDPSHFALSEEPAAIAVKKVLDWSFSSEHDTKRVSVKKIHLSQHEGEADYHNLGVAEEGKGRKGAVPNKEVLQILTERLSIEQLTRLDIILETAVVLSPGDLEWLGNNVDANIRERIQLTTQAGDQNSAIAKYKEVAESLAVDGSLSRASAPNRGIDYDSRDEANAGAMGKFFVRKATYDE
ncbi:MAG: cyclic nucleotide-binding domain-containing protein, partial [Candidatus Gorgyraea atricola]|nr:cyclic nucleotide-binding domain-containing protein [Candidatus Gorgyraea atricola]